MSYDNANPYASNAYTNDYQGMVEEEDWDPGVKTKRKKKGRKAKSKTSTSKAKAAPKAVEPRGEKRKAAAGVQEPQPPVCFSRRFCN